MGNIARLLLLLLTLFHNRMFVSAYSRHFHRLIQNFSSLRIRKNISTSLLRGGLGTVSAGAILYSYALSSHTASCEDGHDKFAGTAFYPMIEPFKKGMLRVSDLHTIAYSQYGNPNGKAVLVVHGGPGL
jgi:hypothetical protein